MRVAFATTRGTAVDEHFGRAGTFAVYDVTEAGTEFIELRAVADGDLDVAVVETRGMGRAHDDAVADKIGKLADCRIVYFTEIGGPSAAKLVRAGVMPLKVEEGSGIQPTLEQLLRTVRTNPAPWIRKALAADVAANTPAEVAPAADSATAAAGPRQPEAATAEQETTTHEKGELA